MSAAKSNGAAAKSPPSFEARDVKARYVVFAGLTLLGTVFACFCIVAGIVYLSTPRTSSPPSVLDTVSDKTGPRLEVDPQGDRLRLQAAADARIKAYRWTGESGFAQIPIARAIALLAAKGWPDGDTGSQPADQKRQEAQP